MSAILQTMKHKTSIFTRMIQENVFRIMAKFLPVIALIIPFLILYSLYPNTFEPVWTGTWKNRLGYVFFLWLFSMETIVNWEELRIEKHKILSAKTAVIITVFVLPTIFVIFTNYLGLKQIIIDLSTQFNIRPAWAALMPLTIEYLVFAFLFAMIVFLEYGSRGIKGYSVSTFFLVIIGAIYAIDNIYPLGEFAPFQILVTPTATFAANILSLMGYHTTLDTKTMVPYLFAQNPKNPREYFGAYIDWPCSGVESLLIYTVTILLFLKKSGLSLKAKAIYFLIGAVVTYFINILRIVTLYTIAIHNGNWGVFHDFYGPFYSIIWIISYPLIIIGSQVLWDKLRR